MSNECFEMEKQSVKEFASGGLDHDDEDPVSALLLELMKKAGMAEDEQLQVFVQGWRDEDVIVRTVPRGLAVFANFDDFSVAFYRDCQPIAAMYCSTRGSLYQAGGYLHPSGQGLYAHNLGGIGGRGEEVDVWEESDTMDADIAKDYLLDYDAVTEEGQKITKALLPVHGPEMSEEMISQRITERVKPLVEQFVNGGMEKMQNAEMLANLKGGPRN